MYYTQNFIGVNILSTITATKNLRTLVAAATSNTAGSTTTGTARDLTTTTGPHLITAKITNGGTGPTLPCIFSILVSGDNSNWKIFRQYTAQTANSGVSEFSEEIPAGMMYVNAQFSGNTGQTVTVESFLHELTNLIST
jgi:hypothetical protein